jgi:DNA-binding transcriptional ArsR family regulator
LIKKHYEMTLSSETSAERDLRRLRTLYRALGDETRLRMIGLLAEFGPMPVNELSARVMLSQPLISWHLRILRLAGVVDTRRNGRERICRLRQAAFEELHETEARLVGGTSGIGLVRSSKGGEVADVR